MAPVHNLVDSLCKCPCLLWICCAQAVDNQSSSMSQNAVIGRFAVAEAGSWERTVDSGVVPV